MIYPIIDTKRRSQSYIQQALDLFDAMSVEPTTAQKTVYNYAIKTYLVDTGTWDELDILHVPYALNETDAKLEWKNPSVTTYRLVPMNSPVFTALGGYTGDGATTYIKTGWIPSTHGVKYQQDDCCFGVKATININALGSLGGVSTGTRFTGIYPRFSNNSLVGINVSPASFATIANTSSIGLFDVRRANSSEFIYSIDNVDFTPSAVVSTPSPNAEIYYLAENDLPTAFASTANNMELGYTGSSSVSRANLLLFINYLKSNLV